MRAAFASPVLASLVYAAAAGLWIVLSDAALTQTVGPEGLATLSPMKGLAFVTITALILFGVLRRRDHDLQREAELRRAIEEQYSRIFQRTHAATLVLDPRDGRIVDANPAAVQLYGYPRAALLERRIHDLTLRNPDEITAIFAAAQREERVRFAAQHRLASGDVREVEVQTSAIQTGDRPLVVSIIHDITERTQAEEQLRASEARYRGLLERASDPIIILDGALGIVEVNARALELVGYTAEQLVGRHAGMVLTPDQLERQPVRFAELAAGRTVHSERVLKHADGRDVHVEISSCRLPDGDFELILRDVTERRQSEEQQRQQQKLEALGQLAGGIAHDLNNVLTVVLANAALVRTSLLDGTGDADADLRELETSAQRGVVMVRKLLSFGRAAPLAVKPTDVAAVVRDLEPMLRRLLPAHIEIDCQAAEPGPAHADAGALEQIVMNLATNARDAMPKGGHLQIRVHPAAAMSDRLILEVRDDGVGMSAETRRRVFEPFFTTKPLGAGTGLGLTVVYGLVVQQLGTISIESVLGEGTCCRIGLPAARADDLTPVEVVSDAPSAWPRGNETILLVEDEDALRSSAARILTRLGYTVVTAEDGLAGLAAFERERDRLHLVLSDVVMPRMGGRAFYDAVRPQAPDLRFLFTSGYSAADLVELQEAQDGRPAMLPKPWTAGELARSVRAALDGI